MSFKHIFDKASKVAESSDYKDTFSDFHNHPELYHFIVAPQSQQTSDTEALAMAAEINKPITDLLLSKGPSLIGSGSTTLDGVESRHILTLVYLLDNLGDYWGNVVEIGGGYGNYLRLIQDIVKYDSWSTIDLDYILDLQEWFYSSLSIDTSNVSKVKSTDIEAQENLRPDIVIAVHSLSELSLEDFQSYFDRVISKSTLMYYVTHRSIPSPGLLKRKLDIIQTAFEVRGYKYYEDETSVMMLLENKQFAHY